MKTRELLAWIAVGAVGAALTLSLFPMAVPFGPRDWQLNHREAEAMARELVRDLGEPVVNPYVMTRLVGDSMLERRLHLESERRGERALREGRLANRVFYWETAVYAPGANPREWTYRVQIGLDGEVLSMRMRLPDAEGSGVADPREAKRAAALFLREQGFDLAAYEEPEVRSQELRARTDSSFRYQRRELELGSAYPYGLEVRFAGDRLIGYQTWFEDPDQAALQAQLLPLQFLAQGRNLVVLVLLPLVAVPFLRRYHAGEIGVRRGLQIGGLLLGLAAFLMAMTAIVVSEGGQAGFLARRPLTWFFAVWMIGFIFLPVALMTVLTWSVGESLSRARWAQKLAAFDAFFQRAWNNATVARSALRGTAAGALLAGLLTVVSVALGRNGAATLATGQISEWWFSAHWASVTLIAFFLIWSVYGELFGRLLLVPLATSRFGRWTGGVLAAIVGGILCWGPGVSSISAFWFGATGALAAGALVILFLRYDLLTSLTANFFASILALAIPLLQAADSWLQFQGVLALIVASLPMILSIKSITSEREFVYRWDDVPPHVRRITERERQRVELETARRIQSSILPELPSELAGVRIAHCYVPATEVGGDFYDIMALEDGRIAVAVGDVAGHGVSSGLVMSMAKAALAVQVTFDPEVESVFRTLNRMIYQSARKRLLTTLCYVLLDPRRRELRYASAGHLFPYRITAEGKVMSLESVSYPLGVRDELAVSVRVETLAANDQLFLFSDGVVEAVREGTDEPFGFERLERSLRRHSADGVGGIRDGVLEDLSRFTGGAAREDDLTMLVLQVP